MSKALDALREHLHIYNPHNAATYAASHSGTGVYITYRNQQPGRGERPAAWQIVRPGFKTDPDGHWQDNGHKTFMVFSSMGKSSEEQEAAAKAWASEKYRVTEWAKIPGLSRSWFPAGDAQIIRDALKAAVKS